MWFVCDGWRAALKGHLVRSTLQGLFGRTATKISDTFSKFSGWGGSKVGYVLQVRGERNLCALCMWLDRWFERMHQG